MAFKIKDNLDLYGNQLLNFALQSDSGFPQSPQVGHMFNYTGTGVMANHAVMCVDETTKAFKALAFVDEIATNTAFTELAERVDDLETALGTDEKDVLDTWEEVKTFLASIKESDGDLMTMLDDKLSKSKSGTINGDGNSDVLTLNADSNCYMYFKVKGNTKAAVGYYNNFTFLSSEIANGARLGITDNGTPEFRTASNTHTLLHSGNIGDYAVRAIGNASVDSARNAAGYDNSGHGTLDLPAVGGFISVGHSNGKYGFQILGDPYSQGLYYRGLYGGELKPWKTIAFTDSDITGNAGSATKLETKRTIWGQEFDGTGDVSGNLYLGTGGDFEIGTVYSSSDTNLYNKIVIGARSTGIKYYSGGWTSDNVIAHDFKVGISPTSAMIVNNSGNVTIGAGDKAGTNYKLYVNGASEADSLYVKGYIRLVAGGIKAQNGYGIDWFDSSGHIHAGITGYNNEFFIATNEQEALRIKPNGYIGIGTDKPQKKLHVVGDLYVEGNIIATKEVSAGGAGQEGESGDGGAEVISQPLAKGQSTYTITNTIKRSDIAVSLYEANVINGQTIWSLCLADIEVTNETITVTFGSATSVNHKLVAVG